MATATGPAWARDYPRTVTAVLTVIGYVAVISTLYVGIPIYPELSEGTVDLLSHAIAAVNATTVALLGLGWYWIRADEVERHRLTMIAAFVLILLFLVLYLLKTGGGGRKDVLAGAPFRTAYLAMLAIHILLSIAAVPLVLYALTLGLTRPVPEIRRTSHRRVGQVAAAAWIVSLALGLVTYAMLAYYYGPEHVEFVRLAVLVPFG